MMVALIVGAEVAFWLFVVGGLAARYLLRSKALSKVLFICVPLVDVVMLVAGAIHLSGGGTAERAHGLAAIYLGFSVAFGHRMIAWADQRFAHRFAGGPAPWKAPKYGPARTRYLWQDFGRAALAIGISVALLGGGILLVGDPSRTEVLAAMMKPMGIVLAIWSIWPISTTIWPSKEPATEPVRKVVSGR